MRRKPPPGRPQLFRMLFDRPGATALILVAVILTGGVVCYGFARYLTAPIMQLRRATRDLAAGDLSVRVTAQVGNRNDEIGDLGRDFNHMAERIDSLVHAERRLLRDISHELRSPLARLNIALGLARQHTTPDAGRPLDRIESEARRLDELIGQLLTLARLQDEASPLPDEVVDLAVLVREVAADADFEAQGRGARVRLGQCRQATLKGHAHLIRSAIENVVRNAVYYTQEGTDVEIDLTTQRDADTDLAVITVRDHGPDLPKEAIEDVFHPFYRAQDARDRQSGGVGLGLAIVQQAVRVHGGIVQARNASGGRWLER